MAGWWLPRRKRQRMCLAPPPRQTKTANGRMGGCIEVPAVLLHWTQPLAGTNFEAASAAFVLRAGVAPRRAGSHFVKARAVAWWLCGAGAPGAAPVRSAQRERGDERPLFIVSAAALSAMAGPQRCRRAQVWAISIRIAEPTLPARKRLISVVANGKRCSSAKISAASAERKTWSWPYPLF